MNRQMLSLRKLRKFGCGLFAAVLTAGSVFADSIENYQVLDWLESDGKQFIDTGVRYGDQTRLQVKLQLVGTSLMELGAIDTYNSKYDRFHLQYQDVKKTYLVLCSSDNTNVEPGWTDNSQMHEYDIDLAAGKLRLDGVEVPDKPPRPSAQQYQFAEDKHSTLWLFGRNGNTDALKKYSTFRIGNTSIWQGDKLERELVPCRRRSDHALGMYDKVRQEFLENGYAGGTPFKASAPAENLPDAYAECEYIAVSDVNQYINTGYNPKVTTDVEAHFHVPSFENLTPLYWVRDASINTFGFILPAGADSSKTVRAYRLSNGAAGTETEMQGDLAMEIFLSTTCADGANTFTLNEETVDFPAKKVDSLDYPITLFALNDHGVMGNAKAVVGTRLYSFNIYEKGELKKRFVPCLKKDGNVAGLYDLMESDMSKAFYRNAGSGGSFAYVEKVKKLPNEFTVPPSITPSAWNPDEAPETVTVDCGAAKYGVVTCSHTEEQIRAFAPGRHAITFSVPETDQWKALSTNLYVTVNYPANWGRVNITFPGYTGTEALYDFPVLVRISDALIDGLQTKKLSKDGADVRFFSEGGTELAHEIDTWNPNGESLVWVKVPELASATTITMLWGGTSPRTTADADVWSAYDGVWHFNGQSDAAFADSKGAAGDAAVPAEGEDTRVTCVVEPQKFGTGVTLANVGVKRAGMLSVGSRKLSGATTVSGWYRIGELRDTTADTYPKLISGGEWGKGAFTCNAGKPEKPRDSPFRSMVAVQASPRIPSRCWAVRCIMWPSPSARAERGSTSTENASVRTQAAGLTSGSGISSWSAPSVRRRRTRSAFSRPSRRQRGSRTTILCRTTRATAPVRS